jgi:5'-methylthioinosine phosphorylase
MDARAKPLGIIGGTGMTELSGLRIIDEQSLDTPWGQPSAALICGELEGQPLVFLARHGQPHRIPPHQVNYRANLWALREMGVSAVVGVNAVGGIHPSMGPAQVVIPDQIIDYTWGRGATYFERKLASKSKLASEGELESVQHIDFTYPYTQPLREALKQAATSQAVSCVDFGVYGATQGPRLETAAEITRLERDGCHLVGMTGMPEAALARELGMGYACLALVVNRAAGKSDHVITMDEIQQAIDTGMSGVRAILSRLPQHLLNH